jgi:folate-binding protein YgfZ
MYYTPLSQRALLSVSGDDALSFLQGLVSSDMHKLRADAPLYAALLSPQGKYLHDFILVQHGRAVWLDGERARIDDLRKRLTLYKLRSQVNIEVLPEATGVVALWGERESGIGNQESGKLADPRLAALGWRMYGDVAEISKSCAAQGFSAATEADYDRHRLALGVPDGSRDMLVDKSILLDWGFEALHGVDFSKGCYVGQEVTARSKFRAQLKKSIHQVQALGGKTLPPAGTPVTAGGQVIGELRSSCGDMGLALLRIEELEKAQTDGHKLQAGEVAVKATLPAWVRV